MAEQERKYPTHLTLRLTDEEWAVLEKAAAGLTVSAHVRERLFGEAVAQRRTRGKAPVKDHESLGQVLALLGKSRLASNVNQLAKAANTGSLPVTPETEAEIVQASDSILTMKDHLLHALGVRHKAAPDA